MSARAAPASRPAADALGHAQSAKTPTAIKASRRIVGGSLRAGTVIRRRGPRELLLHPHEDVGGIVNRVKFGVAALAATAMVAAGCGSGGNSGGSGGGASAAT